MPKPSQPEEKLRYQPGSTYGWHQRDKLKSAALKTLTQYPEWQALLDDMDEQIRKCFRVFMEPNATEEQVMTARHRALHFQGEILFFQGITEADEVNSALEEQAARLWDLMQLDLDKEKYELESQYALQRLGPVGAEEMDGGYPQNPEEPRSAAPGY